MSGTGDGFKAARDKWNQQSRMVRWPTIAAVLGSIVLAANALSATETLDKWRPVLASSMHTYVDEQVKTVVAMQQQQFQTLQLQGLLSSVQSMDFQLSQLRANKIQMQQVQPQGAAILRAISDIEAQMRRVESNRQDACREIAKLRGFGGC